MLTEVLTGAGCCLSEKGVGFSGGVHAQSASRPVRAPSGGYAGVQDKTFPGLQPFVNDSQLLSGLDKAAHL